MGLKFLDDIKAGIRSASLKKDIICYYINNGDNTLADLGKELDLSVPTVTKMVGELIDDGIVMDFGKIETPGGRRPNIYGLNQNSGYFIGVDICHSHVNIGITDFKGELISDELSIPFIESQPQERFQRLCEIITQFIHKSKVPKHKILSMGINISGRVNTLTGHSYSSFYFDERPLTEMFENELNINVSIDNDSRAMTYGEYIKGCVNGEKNVLYVNVSCRHYRRRTIVLWQIRIFRRIWSYSCLWQRNTLPLWQKRLPRNRGFWLSLTPQILGKTTQRTLLSAHPKKRIQPKYSY